MHIKLEILYFYFIKFCCYEKFIIFLTGRFFFKSPVSQFDGILHYESDYDMSGEVGKVLTTIYESGSKVRVESRNISTKSSLGSPGTSDQNVLLYDFDAKQETHLQVKFNRAIIMSLDVEAIQQQKMLDAMGTTTTVENAGNEKIGNYNCTHYIMTSVSSKIKSAKYGSTKKEIWITKDLGSCHLWYIGAYLYYPEGTIFWKKFADAGADGIIVKWQTTAGDLTTSCMLTSYENKSLPATTFSPPSNYTVIKPDLSQLQQKN